MTLKKKMTLASLAILGIGLAYFGWLRVRQGRYTFELWVDGPIPDLNQYAIIEVKDQDGYPMPYGYALYHDAMRTNGIDALLLLDKLSYNANILFGGRYARPDRIENWHRTPGFFGEFPKLEFPGHSNVVCAIQRTQACSNAIAAIEAGVSFQHRWAWADNPSCVNLKDWVCYWSGIDCCHGYVTKDAEIEDAKEAITACSIRAAFPDIHVPRIVEMRPVEEEFIILHGRVPLPVRAKLVTHRVFRFHGEDGQLFAELRIKIANDKCRGQNVPGYRKIYNAIFCRAFKELKLTKGRRVIRGSVCYDQENDEAVVCCIEKEIQGEWQFDIVH